MRRVKMPAVKKKVLFTSHTANFHKFNRPFMRMLKEQGYEVHYASAGEEKVYDTDKHFDIPFERSPFKFGNLKAYFALKKIIDREGYDLIHTHTPMGSVVTRLAARKARKNGTRVIYTAHGFHFFKGAPLLNWIVYYPIEKFLAKYTDALVTINREDYERARKKFSSRTDYVPGVGVNTDEFDKSSSKSKRHDVRKAMGISDTDYVLIYVAELSRRKNQLWLVRSLELYLKENRDTHLLLPGIDSLGGELNRLLESLSLTRQVHVMGYCKNIPDLMNASDVSVSASLQEGLPVNIMESIASGLPVVAINTRGVRDVLDSCGMDTLVDIGDSDTLINRIKSLKENHTSHYELNPIFTLQNVLVEMERVYSPEKRVLHLLASRKFSGAESVAVSIIKSMPDGISAVYCSPSGKIDSSLDIHDIRKVTIKSLNTNELRRIVKDERIDVIHAHDFKASIAASLMPSNIRVISHIHQDPSWMNEYGLKSIAYILRSRRFDKVLVVNKDMAGRRVFKAVAKSKLVVVSNTLDITGVRSLGAEPVNKKYDLVFCGRLEEVKQPLDFLKIVNSLKLEEPLVKAVIIGSGTLGVECRQYVSDNNLQGNVHFVGYQDNPYKYINAGRILAITSKDEGFGLVAAEAVVLGKVVISYDLPAIVKLIGRYDYTSAKNYDDLAHSYIDLLNDHTYKLIAKRQSRSVLTGLTASSEWGNLMASFYEQGRLK